VHSRTPQDNGRNRWLHKYAVIISMLTLAAAPALTPNCTGRRARAPLLAVAPTTVLTTAALVAQPKLSHVATVRGICDASSANTRPTRRFPRHAGVLQALATDRASQPPSLQYLLFTDQGQCYNPGERQRPMAKRHAPGNQRPVCMIRPQ
jgi:hypothetical protein